MFEYESEVEEEILELEPPKDSLAPEVSHGSDQEPGIGPLQVMKHNKSRFISFFVQLFG